MPKHIPSLKPRELIRILEAGGCSYLREGKCQMSRPDTPCIRPDRQPEQMLQKIIECFKAEEYLYSQHARDEMEKEEFGEIRDEEVFETILSGKIIEDYPQDLPYPSCLIYGKSSEGRPLHIVCAYAEDVDKVIIITAYQPDPDLWIDFERRQK